VIMIKVKADGFVSPEVSRVWPSFQAGLGHLPEFVHDSGGYYKDSPKSKDRGRGRRRRIFYSASYQRFDSYLIGGRSFLPNCRIGILHTRGRELLQAESEFVNTRRLVRNA